MGLKETLINHAPDAIKKRFPINKTSFEDFIKFTKTKGKKEIIVKSHIRGEILGRLPEKGHLGFIKFSTIYTSETLEGRPIKFVEIHKERMGTTRDDPSRMGNCPKFCHC